MKQKQAVDAYNALNAIGEMKMPTKAAYKLFKMKKSLEYAFIFEMEGERKLLQEANGIVNIDGTLNFPNMESAVQFNDGVKELGDTEVDLEIEPITMRLDELGDITLKPNDMDRLAGFVNFE